MKIKALAMTGCLAAAMAVPGVAKNTNTENAFQMLKDFRTVADDAARQADRLRLVSVPEEAGWEVHGSYLNALRDDVNRMGKMLANLEAIRDSATPEEQAAIRRVAEWLPSMASNVTQALNYLNSRQMNFWMPEYRRPVDALAVEAARVASASNEAVRLQQLQAKARKLKNELEGA
jgi:anion-transporting  ArsA/GET3 family ATPase